MASKAKPGSLVHFVDKHGRKVVFYAKRKVRSYAQKKAPYQQYRTPAQRKAAAAKARSTPKRRTTKTGRPKTIVARCPICGNMSFTTPKGEPYRTKAQANTWIADHVKAVHSRK